MRPKKNIHRSSNGDAIAHFNAEEFDRLIAKYSLQLQSTTTRNWCDFEQPNDPIGISQINNYKSALVGILREQQALGVNNLSWNTDIWQQDLRSMLDYAKKRKASVKKARYEEKIDHIVAPYKAVQEVEKIELAMWEKGHLNQKSAFTWLRNRMSFLLTTRGILRCESLYKADLSDFVHTVVHPDRDPHPTTALILQMPVGK